LRLLCATAGLALSAAGHAGTDKKILPATICQPLLETPAPDPDTSLDTLRSIRYDATGRVSNDSTTRRVGVVCPVIRDSTERPLNYLRVYYVDNHAGADEANNLECKLRSNTVWGDKELDMESADALSVPPQNPAMEGIGIPGFGSGFWTFKQIQKVGNGDITRETSYTMTCLLPPRSAPTQQSPTGHSYIGAIVAQEPD
jgi:hypothetical protein